MVMRVGGLATGMDIEAMVNKLMEAERMPLMRMQQDQTMLEWKRDAFRDINRELLKLDDLMLDMKLSRTYQSKKVTSSKENAVTATARSSSSAGAYLIDVEQLATPAMNIGVKGSVEDIDKEVTVEGPIIFSTYDSNGEEKTHEIEVEDGDTIKDILIKITNDDNDVRAFYDEENARVILETTRTGKYNPNGLEIEFEENSFFTETLGLVADKERELEGEIVGEIGGENAKFTYNNGLKLESHSNSYELNGVNFQFSDVTDGNAVISVTDDTDHTFDSIMKFVNQYNEVVEALNTTQQEQRYRDFPPLTDEQKDEMTEKQIEQWEEKAKSGILRGESAISNGLFSMRQGWYSNVETGGEITSLTQIGINTSPNYLDGGKLIVDEDTLRQALSEDIEGVQKLFSNSDEGNSRGLVNRLEDAVSSTMRSIEKQAGKEFHTLDNYMIGKRMKDLNDRISSFEDRMVQVETRYWNQFTQMEKAIQRLNDQSSYLFSQFGGGM